MLTKYVYVVCLIPVAPAQTHNQRMTTTPTEVRLVMIYTTYLCVAKLESSLPIPYIHICVDESIGFCWWTFIIHMTIWFHFFALLFINISAEIDMKEFWLWRYDSFVVSRTHTQKNAQKKRCHPFDFITIAKIFFANLLCGSKNKEKRDIDCWLSAHSIKCEKHLVWVKMFWYQWIHFEIQKRSTKSNATFDVTTIEMDPWWALCAQSIATKYS